MIFLHFYKVNNLILHQSYLKSPLPVKLIKIEKKCKKSFFICEKTKNTESAQLCKLWSVIVWSYM